MIIKKNLHLKHIKRIRVAEGRNLKKGLRLDRNEKVDLWPKNFIYNILKKKPRSFFSTYPEIVNLYKKISKFDKVKEDQILITSGIDGSIKNLLSILTNPKDVIAVLSPTYMMYEVYSKIFNLKLFRIGYSKDYEVKKNELNEFFKLKPKILFLPNPNQPIENTFSKKEIFKLVKRCKKINCFLVVDEAYYHFGSQTAVPLIKKFNNVIILRTFSKAFGVPSIRAGYTLSNKDNMKIISKARIAHELSSVSIAVAEYLLDNYNLVKQNCKKITHSRKIIKNKLKKLGLKNRSQFGNYVLIKFNNFAEASKVVKFLRKKLIYVKGPYKKPWDSYINIILGPLSIMKRFLSELSKAKKRKLFN